MPAAASATIDRGMRWRVIASAYSPFRTFCAMMEGAGVYVKGVRCASRGNGGRRSPVHRMIARTLLPVLQPVNNEVGNQLAVRLAQLRRQEIPAEDRPERVQVGYVEKAQCAHQHVNVDRLHVRDEASFAASALEDAVERADDFRVDRPDDRRLAEMLRVMNVLDGH